VPAAVLGDVAPDHDHAVRFTVGEGFEEHAVDDRENRAVRADAEGQGENRGDGQRWCSDREPHRRAQIVRQLVQQSPAPLLPALLFGLRDAAEVDPRLTLGGRPRHAAPEVGGDLLVEMEAELLVDLLIRHGLPGGAQHE
jgi:hypothetical protein